MKKTMSFLLLVLTTALALSCTEEKSLSPEFELDCENVRITSPAQEVRIGYTIENPANNLDILYECRSEWISDITVSKSEIIISVGENSGDEERTADISFSYGDDSETLEIIQDYNDAELFSITLGKITETDLTFSIIVSDDAMTYTATTASRDMANAMDDNELFDEIVKYYRSAAENYGIGFEEFISKLLVKGSLSNAVLSGLTPDCSYSLLVFGMNTSGELTSKIYRTAFDTLPVTQVSITFDFEIVSEGDDTDITVIPDTDNYRYFSYAIKTSEYNGSGISLEEHAQSFVSMMISMLTGMAGLSLEEALDKLLVSGKYTYNHDLDSDTDYIAYAAAVTDYGYICSKADSAHFRTDFVDISTNEIKIELSNINVDRVDYTITTTNDDEYYFTIEESSWREGQTDQQILDDLSKYVYSFMLNSGDIKGTYEPLSPGTEHCLYCFGYAGGIATTELIKIPFKTLASGDDPSSFTFESSISDIDMTSATVNIKGDPYTVLYYWEISSASASKEEVIKQMNDNIDKAVNTEFYNGDRKLYFQLNGSRNTDSHEFTGLLPGTEYKVYAVSIDENTGAFATEPISGSIFKTKEHEISEHTVSLDFGKYFDIDELAYKYGGVYNDFKGQNRYYLKTEVIAYGEITRTYTAAFSNDISGTSDAEMIYNLVDAGKGLTDNVCEFALPYDTDVTLVSVGVDGNGLYTKVYREIINFDKKGASDISEFEPAANKIRSSTDKFPSYIQKRCYKPSGNEKIQQQYDVRPVNEQKVSEISRYTEKEIIFPFITIKP